MSEQAVQVVEQVPAPVQAQGESAALISMIERAARDPNVDIDKMERLFQMHELVTARSAETAYNSAMAEAQAKLVPIAKKKNNDQTRSKYADLAAICEAAMPIVHGFGFGLSFSEFVSTKPNCLGVACEVTHSGGHSKRYEFNVPLDGVGIKGNANMTAPHAYGSSFSYGRRYATCGVFNIATKDDDGNKAAEPTGMITPEQVDEIKALADKAGVTIGQVCEHHSIECLEDMTAKVYLQSKGMLNATIKQRGRK